MKVEYVEGGDGALVRIYGEAPETVRVLQRAVHALAERSGFRPVGGMPTFGGYAVGYYVVQAFLKRTGKSIEETTFLPAEEIVQASGFFA